MDVKDFFIHLFIHFSHACGDAVIHCLLKQIRDASFFHFHLFQLFFKFMQIIYYAKIYE